MPESIRGCKRRCKSYFTSILLAVLCAAAVHAQTGKRPSTPASLSRAGAAQPFFVSAESVRADNGDSRWEAFDSNIRTILQMEAASRKKIAASSAASTESPCDVRTISFDHSPGAAAKFDDIAASAAAVYRGHVVTVTPGFELTTPVTLLGIEIEKVVRADSRFPTTGTVYVIYRQADFSIGGARFCNAGPIPDFEPFVGDRLLLFAFDAPIAAASDRFILTRSEHLVFSRARRLYSLFVELTNASEHTSLKGIEKRVIGATRKGTR
jgi:hypothetical protein